MSKLARVVLAAAALSLGGCGDSIDSRDAAGLVQLGEGPQASGTANFSAVTMKGVVTQTWPGGFTMRHGAATTRVELDEWDDVPEAALIEQGDPVSVRGVVDRGLWERRTIEASSVYIASLDTYLYASAADEEDFVNVNPAGLVVGSADDAIGYVTKIEGRELTIGTGENAVRVNTAYMRDNPLDTAGSPPVRIGDRVMAFGRLNFDPAEGTQLFAEKLIRLVRAQGSAVSSTKTPPADATPLPPTSRSSAASPVATAPPTPPAPAPAVEAR